MTSRMRSYATILALMVVISFSASAKKFYVSPTGSDSAAGTIDQPFRTLAKAIGLSTSLFVPGDTILLRGGTYYASAPVTISRSGSAPLRFCLLNYPGERPILDYSAETRNSSTARGINLSGSFWTVKGIDIRLAGDNGMFVSGSSNIIECCSFSENNDTGLQLSSGASHNLVINCDSYDNVDASQGNADGFSPKLNVGTGNSFFGCRSWQNSDDGWDGYLRPSTDITTTLVNCWSFRNGYLKNGSPSSGNGNGFKMGGGDTTNLHRLMHDMTLTGCLAFGNLAKGFDQNHNRGSMTLRNCTSFANALDYGMDEFINADSGAVMTLVNCVTVDGTAALLGSAVQQTNSWLGVAADTTDFISLDWTQLTAPRKPDGSLPDITFMHLKPGDHLIDAGTDIGLPFNGPAPDLGAFEFDPTTAVSPVGRGLPSAFSLHPAYPNPFNPSTTISYDLPHAGAVTVRIYDLLGRLVDDLLTGHQTDGDHRLVWNGRDGRGQTVPSGMYLLRVTLDGTSRTSKLVLVR